MWDWITFFKVLAVASAVLGAVSAVGLLLLGA